MTKTARHQTEEAFLDAAERLLVDVGHAGITTRAVAQEAAANHGLVHYYFGSMENLLARVLERFTERLIVRQRAMYAADDVPFIEKWRGGGGDLPPPPPPPTGGGGDALPRRRSLLQEGVVRAAGARLDPPRAARAGRAGQRGVARGLV